MTTNLRQCNVWEIVLDIEPFTPSYVIPSESSRDYATSVEPNLESLQPLTLNQTLFLWSSYPSTLYARNIAP
jgi:hypothetical protein